MLNQRRRHSRWRMSCILLVFLGLICGGELAPVKNVPESSSSSTPTAKRKSQDIGSLNDFSWQTWLLVDSHNFQPPNVDSTSLLRRITPKSVFIAPQQLPECAEGYRADNMDRCVKSVNIDEEAHINFLLQRLNDYYANANANNNNDDNKKSTGPLQLNIPLGHDMKYHSTMVEPEETVEMNDPIAMPVRGDMSLRPDDEVKTKPPHATTTTAYEMKNDTTMDEGETTFLNENSSDVGDVDTVERGRPDSATIPVSAEFVEETNDTSYPEAVDNIPMDLPKMLPNATSAKTNASDVTATDVPTTEKLREENSTETSPSALIISPTKLPNLVTDGPPLNVTADRVSDFTSSTAEEIVTGAPDPDVLSPTKQSSTEIPSISDEHRDNETHAEDESAPPNESVKLNEPQEPEFVYDEDEDDTEYSYSTDVPDEEDSTEVEREEILKHGEAGMTFPTRNVEQRPAHRDQQNQTADRRATTLDDQIVIRFNESTPADDKDEMDSNVSSEVSIDGDLILETTLLDVNTEKLQVTTKSPDATQRVVKNDGKEPEVVLSQDAHGVTSGAGRKRIDHVTRVASERNEELVAAPSSSESLLYDPPEEDPITETRTEIGEKQSTSAKENPKDYQSNVPANSFRRTMMNLGLADDYVRLSDHARLPQSQPVRQPSGYVRFPSSEANSVHSPSYKQHPSSSRYPADDRVPYGGGGTSTKSSVPVRQKPVYYLAAPSWKSQPDRVPPADERQKQRSDVLRFWRNVPLVRDPAIYPVDRLPSDEGATDENDARKRSRDRSLRASRRSSFGASSGNVDRLLLAQKRKISIDD